MKRKKTLEEVPFQHTSELPDCVISYIFSKLSIKDLVKTSALSKRWLHEWGSRMDLIFDLHNMSDYNACELSSSEFARRVDQFMLRYRGAKIRSLRVDFPLGVEHNDFITRLISQGIAKGAERIELLSTSPAVTDLLRGIKPYKFPCSLLSEGDSLKYLHLRNCLLVPPINSSGFKNLRSLVLHQVVVEQDLLPDLFSNCIHLVDLTLNMCEFNYDLKITCPTLCYLNIVEYGHGCKPLPWKIDIFALNLSSFEYARSGANWTRTINITAPLLSKFTCSCYQMPPVEFSGLKNLRTIVLNRLLVLQDLLPCLFSNCLQLEDLTLKRCTLMSDINIISPTLQHLNIIDCGPKLDHRLLSKIDIDTLNLSSFEYGGYHMTISSIKAPRLLKFYLDATWNEEMSHPFDLIASLHQLENLTMVMSHSLIARLPRDLGPFKSLRQLELVVHGEIEPHEDFFWILDIVMAFPSLQKLVLTIRHSHLVAYQRQRREHAGFFHNELKYVELHGCVGNTNEIELASLFLKNVNSLRRITLNHCNRFDIGAGRWTKGFDNYNWFRRGHNLIREMLKDEVNEQCQLVIL